MSKQYDNYEPIPLRFIKSDGTIIKDAIPTTASGGAGGTEVKITGPGGDAVTYAGDTDAVPKTDVGLMTNARSYLFDEVTQTWSREYNNSHSTMFPSGAHTAKQTSPVLNNFNGKGVVLYLNVTANPGGSETLNMNLYFIDPVSNQPTPLTATMTIPPAANDTYMMMLYPGATTIEQASINKLYSLPLPRNWQVEIIPSGTGSWTYSVGYSIML